MKNKKTLATVFAVFVLLVLCGGISFAAYNYISNAEINAIKTGQIIMSYTEPSNTVILKNALPKSDDLGIAQDEYFEFSVMSNAKTNEDDDRGISFIKYNLLNLPDTIQFSNGNAIVYEYDALGTKYKT